MMDLLEAKDEEPKAGRERDEERVYTPPWVLTEAQVREASSRQLRGLWATLSQQMAEVEQEMDRRGVDKERLLRGLGAQGGFREIATRNE